jgi:hypothetical protein
MTERAACDIRLPREVYAYQMADIDVRGSKWAILGPHMKGLSFLIFICYFMCLAYPFCCAPKCKHASIFTCIPHTSMFFVLFHVPVSTLCYRYRLPKPL